jgi:hypothetical protein
MSETLFLTKICSFRFLFSSNSLEWIFEIMLLDKSNTLSFRRRENVVSDKSIMLFLDKSRHSNDIVFSTRRPLSDTLAPAVAFISSGRYLHIARVAVGPGHKLRHFIPCDVSYASRQEQRQWPRWPLRHFCLGAIQLSLVCAVDLHLIIRTCTRHQLCDSRIM